MEETTTIAAPTLASDVEEAWRRTKRARIRVSPSAPNTRASSIGHDCERFLYYERTANEQRIPHDEDLQAIFDIGNLDESYVLRELEMSGVEVVQRGRDYVWPDLQLSGHVDAKLRAPGWSRAVVSEIKSMSPHIWDRIVTIDDLVKAKHPWLRKYPAQLQVYMLLSNEERGLFVLLNKSTGRLRVLEMRLDYGLAEALLRKAERVRDAVRTGTAPDRHLSEECDRCPFAHICLPDRLAGEGVGVVESAELVTLLDRRAELQGAASEFKEVDEAIKGLLPEKPGELLAGDWLIKTAERERRPYQVQGGKYLVRTYLKPVRGK